MRKRAYPSRIRTTGRFKRFIKRNPHITAWGAKDFSLDDARAEWRRS